jgi:hypothetical protein
MVQYKRNAKESDMPCSVVVHPKDGGSLDPRNVGILAQNYTASQPSQDLDLEVSPRNS